MSCLRLSVGSTRLQPPGLTQQMEGPGVLASPMRRMGGASYQCLHKYEKFENGRTSRPGCAEQMA
eukprot:3027297-Amphidinium_carterae.2